MPNASESPLTVNLFLGSKRNAPLGDFALVHQMFHNDSSLLLQQWVPTVRLPELLPLAEDISTSLNLFIDFRSWFKLSTLDAMPLSSGAS